MILRVTRDSGFHIIDSSSVKSISFDPKSYKESCVTLHTTTGEFLLSVEELSELADQGFELAKEAVAACVADRMIHGEPKYQVPEHLKELQKLYAEMQRQQSVQYTWPVTTNAGSVTVYPSQPATIPFPMNWPFSDDTDGQR